MVETFLKIPYAAAISGLQLLLGRPRLRLECGWCHEPNESGVGNYLALWIKIINPSREVIYFERLQGCDSKGELFFPMVKGVDRGQAISPRNKAVALIPCGHVLKPAAKELSVVDATESVYRLKGRKLSQAIAALSAEVNRCQALGLEVHPVRA
jgi:hypothetical protein